MKPTAIKVPGRNTKLRIEIVLIAALSLCVASPIRTATLLLH